MRFALPAASQRAKSGSACRATIHSGLFGAGGKDPAIVMPSADIRWLRELLFGVAWYDGSGLSIAERIYCHKAVYDQLIEELTTSWTS